MIGTQKQTQRSHSYKNKVLFSNKIWFYFETDMICNKEEFHKNMSQWDFSSKQMTNYNLSPISGSKSSSKAHVKELN